MYRIYTYSSSTFYRTYSERFSKRKYSDVNTCTNIQTTTTPVYCAHSCVQCLFNVCMYVCTYAYTHVLYVFIYVCMYCTYVLCLLYYYRNLLIFVSDQYLCTVHNNIIHLRMNIHIYCMCFMCVLWTFVNLCTYLHTYVCMYVLCVCVHIMHILCTHTSAPKKKIRRTGSLDNVGTGYVPMHVCVCIAHNMYVRRCICSYVPLYIVCMFIYNC